MKTWRQMEALVDRGLVRHIGTSNMTIPKLKLVLRDARIKPACNEMELHPHFQQPELFRFVVDQGIVPIGYCPIGSPNRPERDRTETDTVDIEDPVIVRIAERLGVHPGHRVHQVGSPARAGPHSLLRQAAAILEQPEGGRRRAAHRAGHAGHRRDRQELPADQGPGVPLEGRSELGRPVGSQRRDHPSLKR